MGNPKTTIRIFTIGTLIILAGVFQFLFLMSSTVAAPMAQLTPFRTPTPGADGRIIYVVQTGDSLWRISAVSGIPVDELRALNNLGTNDVITPGQELLLGLAGPAGPAPTPGPPPTATSELPTPTPGTGTGTLCVLLYEDLNGDSIRQEEEPSLPGGAISINDRFGDVSLTAETPSGGISENLFPEPEELGFTCFENLDMGEYNVTVASPSGYNATTPLSKAVLVNSDEEVLLDFGAQPNSETLARAPLSLGPDRSPILGVLGALILLVGTGLGIYTFIFHRK